MNWEEVRKEYEETDITMKDLAEKFEVKPSTLRSRKNREKWQRNATNNVATKNATQHKSVATQKVTQKTQEVLSESNLKDWEEVFCLEYLTHFNKTKAYRKARPGTTYESARVLGSSTFAKINIQARLKELKQAQREDLYIGSLDIKEAWAKQAFADITDFVDFGTEEREEWNKHLEEMETVERSFVRLKDVEEVDGTLVQEVKLGRDGVSVKLYDKQKALQELLKMLGEDTVDSEKVFIINNSNDERMKKWVEENGGL